LSDLKKGFVKLNPVRGWLFDVYPSGPDEITVWLIAENGERVRFVDRFVYKIFVSGSFSDLKRLAEKVKNKDLVIDCRMVEKTDDFMERRKSRVLEVSVKDHTKASHLATELLRFNNNKGLRFYNVDVTVPQAYLYDRDVFPFAHMIVVASGKRLCYVLLDSAESVDYSLPNLRSLLLKVSTKKEGVTQKLTDKIDSLSLECDGKTTVIECGSEKEKILELVKSFRSLDPDIVFTEGGDSFWLPYLAHRAFVNGVLEHFVLSREEIPLKSNRSGGTTFFSYGRVYHKAPMQRLFGRIHIDVNNTFIYTACGLDGLVEVSRTCRVPIHRSSRASIGTIMSSLQLYTAWKDNILIPWKKNEPESFKTAWELLVADRGGFIFEPKIGFHTDIFEVDFTSMFPTLMLTRNISAETVRCKCCPDSNIRVPELGYNICEKRRGIVPKTLELLLRKRSKYKRLLRETEDPELRRIYSMRQAALKWILVTCFGYLGYRNARFGRVDAHIAVCAFARDSLLKTARLAEGYGFEVIHGIVDSLWLKKPHASSSEIIDFCHEASKAVNVNLGVEGKYRWIVFLPSKVLEGVPVLNRYYGVFENGDIKLRGVEARRGDTPLFVVKAQMEMIRKLTCANSLEVFKEKIPEALRVLRVYADKLIDGQVDLQELLVTKRISKAPSNYTHDVFQAIAAKQLEKAGFEVHAGQTVQYLITNAKSKWVNERIAPAELLKSKTHYDVKEYVKLLISAGETLFNMFGYDKHTIQIEALYNGRQQMFLQSEIHRK
jgi:DNA polymerase elongation subunit (family B)